MAVSPLGALPDFSRIPTVAPVDPLQTLLQGFQQGQSIANLPQTIQQNALNAQIQQAIALQKLQQLGQPEIINTGGGLYIRDPNDPNNVKTLIPPQTAASRASPFQLVGQNVDPTTKELLGGLGYNPNTNTFAPIPLPEGVQQIGPKVTAPVTPKFTKRYTNANGFLMNQNLEGPDTPALDVDGNPIFVGVASQNLVTDQGIVNVPTKGTGQATPVTIEGKEGPVNLTKTPVSKSSETSSNNKQYLIDTSDMILSSIERLKPQVDNTTVGIGSLTSIIPGSPARNFQAQLKVLTSGIFRQQLQAMRAASKTGGAVGNVSNKEGDRFENALGALDQAQSVPAILEQLDIIADSTRKHKEAIQKSNVPISSNGKITIIAPDGQLGEWPSNKPIPDGFKLSQ